MPGPRSSNVSRSPRRGSLLMASSLTVPPPPWSSVLRANSLAAVTILVWSTRLRPCATAHSRATCRTRTTSSDDLIDIVSSFATAIDVLLLCSGALEQAHAFLDVERGAHARQREAQLDERNGYRRAHPDDYRFRVQHARHRRDVAEHPADERVHDFQRGNVNQHAPSPCFGDPLSQVVLQRQGEAVVHVHLDRDEQVISHL